MRVWHKGLKRWGNIDASTDTGDPTSAFVQFDSPNEEYLEVTRSLLVPDHGYITTTSGMSGHFAVMIKIYNDIGNHFPYPDVWTSGIGRYKTSLDAALEGRDWALSEELPFGENEWKDKLKKIEAGEL